MSENRVIGRDGALPWRLPDDLKRFKRLTMDHAVIMGRRTFESLPGPLPGRRMIVLTRNHALAAPGAEIAASLDDALALAGDDPEPFVIGGAAVYEIALPRAGRLHVTQVHAVVEGDVRFPEVDLTRWREAAREPHAADERHAHAFTFLTLEKTRDSHGFSCGNADSVAVRGTENP